MDSIKSELFNLCKQHTQKRIEALELTKNSIEEARNKETKSTAGDKHETGRAMMQIEEEKINRQLFQAIQSNKELLKIDFQKRTEIVTTGSLVKTNKGAYFIAIGLGKVQLNDQIYYCVSVNSPIGKNLIGKEKGHKIEFNGSKIVVEEIY